METGTEMHKRITDDITLQQKLQKENRGQNLINYSTEYEKPYYIHALLEVTANLTQTKTRMRIKHNLPFSNYEYDSEESPQDFVKELKEFVAKPLVVIPKFNRKNNLSSYELKCFKTKSVMLTEVDVKVYPEALKKLPKFETEVKELLNTQRNATIEEARDVKKWVVLLEKALLLNDRTKQENNYYSDVKQDETEKLITLTDKEYNAELKKVEAQLVKLTRKHRWLQTPQLSYKQIPELPKFKDYKESYEVKEAWAGMNEAEQAEFKSFNAFAKANHNTLKEEFEK